MDPRRLFLLILLCALVFVGWSFLVNLLYPPPPPPAAVTGRPSPTPTPGAQATPAPTPRPDPGPRRQPEEQVQETVLENEVVRFVMTNRGAGVLQASSKLESGEIVLLLPPPSSGPPHLAIEDPDGIDDLATGAWTLKASEPGRSLTYGYLLRGGGEIERRYLLEPKLHSIKAVTSFAGEGSAPPGGGRRLAYRMIALHKILYDSDYYYERYSTGAVGMRGTGGSPKLQSVAIDKPSEFTLPKDAGEAWHDWFGLRSRFFAALIVPDSGLDREWFRTVRFKPATQRGERGQDLKGLAVEAVLGEVPAGAARFTTQFRLFLAPIKQSALREVPGAAEFVNYGCCGLISPVGDTLSWVLGGVHYVVGNYGWAIVLMTILVKVVTFPMSRKAQVSMSRMGELQPKIQKLQERYASDPQKMNQEMWKLWREEKVAPWSGCLPMMITLPIFAGLYGVFDASVEFRHAPFILWMKDLSQPDRLAVLSNPINLWLFEIRELNLLPILMTVVWFLQSLWAPKSPDPNMAMQQKMMLIMPVFFGFVTYYVASGLSLYMVTNFALSLIEQKVIKTYFVKKKPAPAVPGA